jgi:hypothetical protein
MIELIDKLKELNPFVASVLIVVGGIVIVCIGYGLWRQLKLIITGE